MSAIGIFGEATTADIEAFHKSLRELQNFVAQADARVMAAMKRASDGDGLNDAKETGETLWERTVAALNADTTAIQAAASALPTLEVR